MTTAYPLAWPPGWPRTPAIDIREGKYHFRRAKYDGSVFWTFADARDALIEEVKRLNGGGPVVISSNFRLARDGYPVEGGKRPQDQGVALYFDLGGQPKVMARDAFIRAEENMRSLALAIEAMRALERHGGSLMMSRAFEGFVALPAPGAAHVRPWWEVLGVRRAASRGEIEAAFKQMAKRAHPDIGGSDAAMAEVTRARDEGLRDAG